MRDFKNAVPIHSEEIEPFAALLVGRLWKRCEVAKETADGVDLESACLSFWFGLRGLEKIAIAASTATHFSIAMNNEHQRVASYIESVLGVNPIDANW